MRSAQNHLIERLPRQDRLRLLAICEPFELQLAQVLCDRGAVTEYVYFPVDGFVSLVAQLDDFPGVEVGMVGREGMLGVHVALDALVEPLRMLVQGPGTAWRVSVGAFRQILTDSVALRRTMHAYLYVLMAQQAVAASCLRFHQIDQRLARWLLMSQDRAHRASFYVTQEFMAYMLGVRRVGITTAAGALQSKGLVAYHRGEFEVLDRRGLQAQACSCYAAERKVYADWLA